MYDIFEQLLKEHGVTAYRVAKETGVTTATLTSWKQGKYTPKPEKLQKIADYFNVSLSYLTVSYTHLNLSFLSKTVLRVSFYNLFNRHMNCLLYTSRCV